MPSSCKAIHNLYRPLTQILIGQSRREHYPHVLR